MITLSKFLHAKRRTTARSALRKSENNVAVKSQQIQSCNLISYLFSRYSNQKTNIAAETAVSARLAAMSGEIFCL